MCGQGGSRQGGGTARTCGKGYIIKVGGSTHEEGGILNQASGGIRGMGMRA